MSDIQTTSINRSWLVKMIIFAVVLLGFGCWSLYDAISLYPARGEEDIKYKLKDYLTACRDGNRLVNSSVTSNPAALHDELDAKSPRSAIEDTQLGWLTALKRMGRLSPEHTTISDPATKLRELDEYFKVQNKPAPLTAWDIPLQWCFAVIGFTGGILIVLNILLSLARKYTWDASTKTLTLSGGKQISPATLGDVDKRKWDKFLCTIVPADGSKPVELDVLKYNNLESWVLELEAAKFPERAVVAPVSDAT